VEITPVPAGDGRGLDRFIAFPYDHYRNDPLWVPQLRRDMHTLLSPSKNPFFQHAEAQYWTARRPDGRTVGRIGAIKNDMHNREHNDRVGFYGFFESIDDQQIANALWDTAAAWLRSRGFDTMRGPMSPSVNDECGLLIANNGTPPSLMMPYNFPYYETLHERYGFTKAKDLLAYDGGHAQAPPERFVRLAQRAAKRRGITLRTLDKKRFDAEVELIKALYNSAWEKNWGFVPLTEAEIDHLAKQLKPIVVPDLVVFAELEGKMVGFGVGLPDFNLALLHNRSGRMFPGILKVLWYSRKIHRARILLLGVIPEFRGRGVDALLYQKVWENSVKHGMPSGEAGWILEDNALMNKAATQLGFRVSKTYRVYDKPL
jgi:GNAT superfamily N-acetyltransferase